MNDIIAGLPPQQLAFSKKTKEWRKKHLDWADNKSFFNYSPVRNSVMHKKINYDLLNGKLHMTDLERMINPEQIRGGSIPDSITHYPIINPKLNILRGEEAKRIFDFKVIVTNPNSISEIENTKKELLYQKLQQLIADKSQDEESFNKNLESLSDYFTYEWQDSREIRANELLNHYMKELNIPMLFNDGFMDAMTVGEEIYMCDIVGGEPIIERLNPLKVRVFQSGHSNKIEDADMVIIEDYWSPGRIIDTFYDVLTEADRKYIEGVPSTIGKSNTDALSNLDESIGFIPAEEIGDAIVTQDGFWTNPLTGKDTYASLNPYDTYGNIRVLRVFWKSRRKIKKVKSYNPMTGEEMYNFYPETYKIKEELGEEEQIFWINEAWEGTKIGAEVYVNMRPRVIQYNRLSNPSKCHFGIVGSIYNLNEGKPFSMVDMMKQYNYYYDVIHDRLNKHIAKQWGTIARLDLAKVPTGWKIDKWIYYAKNLGIAVEDSFKEGTYGAATGKIAGGLNNASSGAFTVSDGNMIQQYINLLEFIKMEMAEVVGISKQREGQVSNRETVGGVERATLQSSYITEWLFTRHDDVKKRALECFIETAKIALTGGSHKFQYILSDNSQHIIDIDGDVFAESDYGLVVDNTNGTQELNSKIDMLAQAALQNQTASMSTIMKMYTSTSMAEKIKMLENNEKKLQAQREQEQQIQQQQFEQQLQANAEQQQAQMEFDDAINQRDNETKIVVAEINSQAEADRLAMMNGDTEYTEKDKEALKEQMRQFDKKIQLENAKFEQQKKVDQANIELKKKQLSVKRNTSNK